MQRRYLIQLIAISEDHPINKMSSCVIETKRVLMKGHDQLQTVCPKSVRSGNERPLIALRCLLLMLVSTPLQFVNRCFCGFPGSGGI